MELRWIAFNGAEVLRTTARDLDRFGKRSLLKIDHLVNEMAWLNRNALAFDPSRKGEHLLNHARPALPALLYQRDGRFPVFTIQTVAQRLRANQNRSENVIKIVRHTAGKCADVFEPLRSHQLHLEFFLLGDVGVDSEHRPRSAVVISNEGYPRIDNQSAPILGAVLNLPMEFAARNQLFEQRLAVVRFAEH